jgi:hypothetical protein
MPGVGDRLVTAAEARSPALSRGQADLTPSACARRGEEPPALDPSPGAAARSPRARRAGLRPADERGPDALGSEATHHAAVVADRSRRQAGRHDGDHDGVGNGLADGAGPSHPLPCPRRGATASRRLSLEATGAEADR